MRHRVDHRKLGRTQAHRKAMLANMVTSLFDRERIKTTSAKAKEARRQAERLITRAKKGYVAYQEHQSLKEAGKETEAREMQAVALAHWRQAGRVIKKQATLKKLFDVIAPMYLERDGGYTRILRLRNRPGDNAKTVLLELVGREEAVAEEAPKGKQKAAEDEEGAKGAKASRRAADEGKAPKEKAAQEKAAKDRAAKEKTTKEKTAKEKAARGKAAKEKAPKQKGTAKKAGKEKTTKGKAARKKAP